MDKQEFKDIWLPLSDGFFRVAYSILRSEQDSRDMLQDLYIRLWNMRDSLEHVRFPSAYGTRILRNMCIDRIRDAGRDKEGGPVLESAFMDGQSAPPADRMVMNREMIRCLSRAVAALPAMQKTVVEMRFFRQMPYSEIVRQTGMSAISARVLVSRARKSLQSAMKEFINVK